MASLDGKKVAITGAASGIGLAIARLLASRGARVSLADQNQEALTEAVASLPGENHMIFVLDVRDSAQVDSWMREITQRMGKLDAAVNCAGVGRVPHNIVDETDDMWNLIMDVNAKGVFNCTRAELRQMADNGSIVNIASAAGLFGTAGSSIYTASKHAVIGLTRSVSKEVGDRKIRVNAIAPGVIATPMVAMLTEAGKDLPTNMQTFNRFADPNEVASVAAFLVSDESSFVTGATYTVDGGLTA